MLPIAISYGTYGDPFSCSTNVGVGDVNPDNADECRAYICKDKKLPLEAVDEILVVDYDKATQGEPEVVHQYSDKMTPVIPEEMIEAAEGDFTDSDESDSQDA